MKNVVKKLSLFLTVCCLVFGMTSLPMNQSFASPNGQDSSDKQILLKAKQEAKKGKVINSEFGLGVKENTIKQKYGKPDAESEFYLDYHQSRQVGFRLDSLQKVNHIATTDQQLLQVTQETTQKVLGTPQCMEGAMGTVFWTYKVKNYALTFVWDNIENNKLRQVTVKEFVPVECNPTK